MICNVCSDAAAHGVYGEENHFRWELGILVGCPGRDRCDCQHLLPIRITDVAESRHPQNETQNDTEN